MQNNKRQVPREEDQKARVRQGAIILIPGLPAEDEDERDADPAIDPDEEVVWDEGRDLPESDAE